MLMCTLHRSVHTGVIYFLKSNVSVRDLSQAHFCLIEVEREERQQSDCRLVQRGDEADKEWNPGRCAYMTHVSNWLNYAAVF